MSEELGHVVLGLGSENAARLATAYRNVVSILSLDDHSLMPPPSARAAMLRAMLSHGRIHGFDENRLALAGLASVQTGRGVGDEAGDDGCHAPGPGGRAWDDSGGAALRRARGIRLPQQTA